MRGGTIVAVRAAALAAALAVGLGGAGTALAAPNPVITDCNATGHLTQQYSATQLRAALATLPADVKEYTDCYDVIQRALLTALGSAGHGGGSGGGGSGGSFLPVPVIVVIVLLGLGGAGYGLFAARRRRE